MGEIAFAVVVALLALIIGLDVWRESKPSRASRRQLDVWRDADGVSDVVGDVPHVPPGVRGKR